MIFNRRSIFVWESMEGMSKRDREDEEAKEPKKPKRDEAEEGNEDIKVHFTCFFIGSLNFSRYIIDF